MAENTPTLNTPIDNKNKIDVAKALQLRLNNKLSLEAIAKQFGVSRQAIHQSLKRFTNLIKDPEIIHAYNKNDVELLKAAEFILLSDIVDKTKRQKATQGNVAYALDKIHNIRRLKEDKSTQNIGSIHADLQEIKAMQGKSTT